MKTNTTRPRFYTNNPGIAFGAFCVVTINVPLLAYGIGKASSAYLTNNTVTSADTHTITHVHTPATVPAPPPFSVLGLGIGLLGWPRGYGRPPATTSVCPVT